MDLCNADTCVGLSSGTAGLYKSDAREAGKLPGNFLIVLHNGFVCD